MNGLACLEPGAPGSPSLHHLKLISLGSRRLTKRLWRRAATNVKKTADF